VAVLSLLLRCVAAVPQVLDAREVQLLLLLLLLPLLLASWQSQVLWQLHAGRLGACCCWTHGPAYVKSGRGVHHAGTW
jgi:hypothetical protein